MFRSAWNVNGLFNLEEADSGRVLFTFSDPADKARVWRSGPWGFNRASASLPSMGSLQDIILLDLATGDSAGF
ncbi:hypothetical protein RchiOBHm_Chr1g0321991 [Rosa chinensis]|uniref:DUF4283 domain-containing protein n=1 Tax=Rosa chinensis TaxID=74649 RepID=A0A2P6S955_ROSCH|nr:hypothetical protein RchiOBHm_Chr1g0321991 [Rosa chinensis]